MKQIRQTDNINTHKFRNEKSY